MPSARHLTDPIEFCPLNKVGFLTLKTMDSSVVLCLGQDFFETKLIVDGLRTGPLYSQ